MITAEQGAGKYCSSGTLFPNLVAMTVASARELSLELSATHENVTSLWVSRLADRHVWSLLNKVLVSM